MKFWVILLVIALAVLSACRSDRVDIRDLTPKDRALFTEVAAVEGVDTTIHGRPGDWTVEYDFGMLVTGISTRRDFPSDMRCKIRINPDRLRFCENESREYYFGIIARHELRHCDGQNHSSNPDNLMFSPAPCWPVD